MDDTQFRGWVEWRPSADHMWLMNVWGGCMQRRSLGLPAALGATECGMGMQLGSRSQPSVFSPCMHRRRMMARPLPLESGVP